MNSYILAIAGIVLISALVAVIAPRGKMGDFLKGSTRLLLLIVMVSPLFGLDGTAVPEGKDGYLPDESYLAGIAERLGTRDEEELEALIRSELGISAEVDVKREISAYFPLVKITVRTGNEGINGEEERIHIVTRIKELLAPYCGEIEVL